MHFLMVFLMKYLHVVWFCGLFKNSLPNPRTQRFDIFVHLWFLWLSSYSYVFCTVLNNLCFARGRSTIVCRYLIVTAPTVFEKATPVYQPCWKSTDHYVRVYFWIFYAIPFTCMSILILVWCGIHYCIFTVTVFFPLLLCSIQYWG
jgi:hypothetical protein